MFGRLMLVVSLALTLVVVSSCGGSGGFIRDASTLHFIQHQIPAKTFRFVKNVSGEASTGSVFCSIPIYPDVYMRARDAMYQNAKLTPNQAITDLIEDHTTRFYLFYCEHYVVISGTVVEFGE